MIEFKAARIEQASEILAYIKKIAIYEKMENEVLNSVELIEKWIFNEQLAHVIFAYDHTNIVGFALYYYHYSTFSGLIGLYVEDVFIDEDYRNQGIGKQFFQQLASCAEDKGCGRMEWCCLKWNVNSIAFYESLGAIALEEWNTFRLDAQGIKKVAHAQ